MIYSFDDYVVDAAAYEVRRGPERVEMEPGVLELLLFLIENRDRIVTKDELFGQVWKGRVVSDATLSSRIKTLRQALGDDGSAQKVIRTIHGRGFRFVADAQATSGNAMSPARVEARETPTTRYARSGDIHVAYQLFGDGAVDLIIVPGFVSHIENYWDDPHLARWLTRLGTMARVAMFDKRGTGLSDRVSSLPGLDQRMDDVRAVMDAVGFERAAVMGISEGGSLASVFAASHPDRSRALILYGAFASFKSWFPTDEALDQLFHYIETSWGSGESLPAFAPGMADDAAFKSWWGKFERLGANPGAATALMRMNSEIDITDILPSIRIPTLVIHRADDVLIDVEGGRTLAARIPNARYVELPGVDHLPWVGDHPDRILDEIERFLGDMPTADTANSILTTVLCVELNPRPGGGPKRRPRPDPIPAESLADLRDCLIRFNGREVAPVGSAFMAAFSGPARAIYCALEIAALLRRSNLKAGIGLHTGEAVLSPTGIQGTAVDIAARVTTFTGPGQVLVSRTIKDLVAGSGISFQDRGTYDVGDSEPWRVYEVSM